LKRKHGIKKYKEKYKKKQLKTIEKGIPVHIASLIGCKRGSHS